MEINNSFRVEEKDGKIIVNQLITKEMDVKESVQELQKLKQEMKQVQKQKDDLQKSIDEKKFETELEKITENISKLDEIEKQWNKLILPALDKIKKEVKAKVKGMKASAGYERMTDETQKQVARTRILTDCCTELNLEPQHPVFQEIRQEFDKI